MLYIEAVVCKENLPLPTNRDTRQTVSVDAEAPSSQETGQVHAPTVSLPKGGGAIRGTGERFSVNPVTGT